jgi:DNA-binding transcriptional regulator YdaS (Cro superfamily)
MSATKARLLRAASEIVGGNSALANYLGISETLLSRFIADRQELPDALLLRAVDIILADRQSEVPPSAPATANGRSAGAR